MIRSVKFVSIPTRNQDAALAFYTQKIGLSVMTDQPMGPGGQRWIELGFPGGETRLVLFTPEGQEDRIGTFTSISLECDDVERTYADLSARGVKFDGPPTKMKWGSYVIMHDADGNKMVVGTK